MISEEEKFHLFAGPNAEDYAATFKYYVDLQKYRSAKKSGVKLDRPKYFFTFHLWAFLITLPWMLYRKLYVEAATLMGSIILISLFLPQYTSGGSIGAWVGIGVLGKYMYGAYALRQIKKIEKNHADEETLRSELVRKGGVSTAGAWVGAGLIVLSVAMTIYFRFTQELPGCDSAFFRNALDSAKEETAKTIVEQEGMENAVVFPFEVEEIPSQNIGDERLCSVSITIQNESFKMVTPSTFRIYWRDEGAGIYSIEGVSTGEPVVTDLEPEQP